MANTIQRSDINNGIAIELTCIQTLSIDKTGSVVVMPMPFSDSDGVISTELGGSIRTIGIDGEYVGSSLDDLTTFANNLQAFCCGSQSSKGPTSLHLDLLNETINCAVMSVHIDYTAGVPLRLRYNIMLTESSVF